MDERYYRLEGKRAVRVAGGVLEWAQAFEKADTRRVAHTSLSGDIIVSTVFLGLDHNWGEGRPLLFETMIFGGLHDQWQDRYSTWEEAETGHERVVQQLKLGLEP